jgi:hypothetical protein
LLVIKNSVFLNLELERLENLNLSYKYWNYLSLFNYHYESFLFFNGGKMLEAEHFDTHDNNSGVLTRPKLKRLIHEYLQNRKDASEIENIPDEVDTDWGD